MPTSNTTPAAWPALPTGANEMTPLELNAIPLSSELHSPVAADAMPTTAAPPASGPRKTSLSSL